MYLAKVTFYVAQEFNKRAGCAKDKSIPKNNTYTVEPPNKGHFGANSFVPCREVVPISEVK